MGLIYNEETAVKSSIKQIDREDTASLNELSIYGRSQDLQTNEVRYNFNSTGTQTVTEDFILTGAFIDCSVAGANGVYFTSTALFSNRIIGIGSVGTLYIQIPNWIIKKGTVFASNEGGTMTATLYGYKL